MSLLLPQTPLLTSSTGRPLGSRPFSAEPAAFRTVGTCRSPLRCRADSGDSNSSGDAIKERLRAAEAEADTLRKQLAAAKEAQAQRGEGGASEVGTPKQRVSRIDGAGLQRESPFAQGVGEWLSESDFGFFAGNGPGEAIDAVTSSPEESAVVKRRLIIGGILTAVVATLSVIPTDALRLSKPSKPLFFYLTPLVRVQSLLSDLEKAAQDGETDEVQQGIDRIQGAPNFAVENLRNAAAALPDTRAAEKAGVVARDVIEYLTSIDFNKYYENLQKPSSRGGQMQKMFSDFSLNSIRAAQAKLKIFFTLMPQDQLEAAQQQANATF